MGILHQKYMSKDFSIEGLREKNLIKCFFCPIICHITELLHHSHKCEKRQETKIQDNDQIIIELSLIIFRFNNTICPSKQDKYFEFKGIDFSNDNVFKMSAHLYLLIGILKNNKATPDWVINPGHYDNEFTKYIPTYIFYYFESNKEQIYCDPAGIIFSVIDIIYDVTPIVFRKKFLI